MKTTLLIMAAGIGSRFGTGIKQLEPVDDAGHIIMDYSIHDAIEAGFNHVVFGYIPAIRHLLQHSRWSSRWFGVLCGDEGKKASVKMDEIVIYWEQ